jgi:periplasmic copper chaperone A
VTWRVAGVTAALVLALLVVVAGCGGDSGAGRGPDGELTALGAFIPEPPVNIGALYLTLDNRTGVDDALVGASTDPPTSRVDIHGPDMSDLGGRLPLPAGKQTLLEPGGAHVMLNGIDGLQEGGTVAVTLRFAVHPPITIQVPVAPIGSLEAP